MYHKGIDREDLVSGAELIFRLITTTARIVTKIPTINVETAKFEHLRTLVFLLEEAEKEL